MGLHGTRITPSVFHAAVNTQAVLTCVVSHSSNQYCNTHSTSRQSLHLPLRPQTAILRIHILALPLALLHAHKLLTHGLDLGAARVADVRRVPEVRVDAHDVRGDVAQLDAVDEHVAGPAVTRAVAAAAVQLAGVDGGEAADGDGADAVVLDDLVDGVGRAAAVDQDVALAEERYRVWSISLACVALRRICWAGGTFTDIPEPDVGQGAGALAVDAFERVAADDDVGDAGAVLEDEDGVFVARVLVAVARLAAVEFLVVEVLGAGDDARGGEGVDVSRSGRDVEGLCGRGRDDCCVEESHFGIGKL